eukprot:TRINITY_DN5584_c0_g1_i2.p1 TRINITY_DN5584_c0_g1~~TRINITY_DN5584_c0_g1_i2.p1  ORF type:complete len:887 (-),score=146.00 TRINITY_DN5584_c0_g1_i2:67-2703(-)
MAADSSQPDIHATKSVAAETEEFSVPQTVYLKYIRQQLDDEIACMELPFTVLLLFSFSMFAILSLSQGRVYSVEQAIHEDIAQNSNFAFSGNMGEKNYDDVHSYPDFWSWVRLGFLPLVVQSSWAYSESRAADVSNVFDLSTSPAVEPSSSWAFGSYSSNALPLHGDYIHYNRIIGGIRFRQQVSEMSDGLCRFPPGAGPSNDVWQRWYGKPCMPSYEPISFEPDADVSENFAKPEREEWMLLSTTHSLDRMIAQAVDMEDGCAQMNAKNRTCYCKWCQTQDPPSPWITDRTQRLEVGMASYNAEYGLLTMTGVNYFFARGGRLRSRIQMSSTWINFSMEFDFALLFFEMIWILMLLYIVLTEGKEVISVLIHAETKWYVALQNDYLGFWNIVDWISILVACVVAAAYGNLWWQTWYTHDELGALLDFTGGHEAPDAGREDYSEKIIQFYRLLEDTINAERFYRLSLCIYPMMMMLRLFKSFAAQPRLAVVTETLQEASQDMLHFGIVLFSVLLTLCLDAVLLFGRDIEDFGNFGRALHSCFRLMFGDWDWKPMEKVNRFAANVWFILTLVFVVIILLNMLLAIIMDNYMNVKKRSASSESLGKQMQEMWRRRQMNKNKERVTLNVIWDAFVEESGGQVKHMCQSNRAITEDFLMELVPDIPSSQAHRTIHKSWRDHQRAHTKPFVIEDAGEPLSRLEAVTRTIRNGLFFAFDRFHFADTRPAPSWDSTSSESLDAARVRLVEEQHGAEQEALLEFTEAFRLKEQQAVKTVIELVDNETARLSSEAAATLAGILQGVDVRQATIESRCAHMSLSVHEMYQKMMNLQSRATMLVGCLQKAIHQKRLKQEAEATSTGRRRGLFDGCSPEVREAPIPIVRR